MKAALLGPLLFSLNVCLNCVCMIVFGVLVHNIVELETTLGMLLAPNTPRPFAKFEVQLLFAVAVLHLLSDVATKMLPVRAIVLASFVTQEPVLLLDQSKFTVLRTGNSCGPEIKFHPDEGTKNKDRISTFDGTILL